MSFIEEFDIEDIEEPFDDEELLKEVELYRKELNQLFKKDDKMNLKVNKKLRVVKTQSDSEGNISKTEVSNLFFFPIKAIQTSRHDKTIVGFRFKVIKKSNKRIIFETIDIDHATLKTKQWITSKEMKKVFGSNKFDDTYYEYLEAINQINEQLVRTKLRMFLVSEIGWIKGKNHWHYVPITTDHQNEIVIDKTTTVSYFNFPDSDINLKQAFSNTLSLIDKYNKNVSLPLFSFSLLSTFTTLINYDFPKKPKYILCLYGGHSKVRNSLANLFCNIYNRTSNLSSINESIHSNRLASEEDLKNKANVIRDGVFIINVSDTSRKIATSKKFIQQNDYKNMILLLGEEAIDHDLIFNIQVPIDSPKSLSGLDVEQDELATSIFKMIIYCKENLFMNFTEKKTTKFLDGLYKKNYRMLENNTKSIDINKQHYCSLMLMGWEIFLQYGLNIEAISPEYKNDIFSESVTLFKELSDVVIEGENGFSDSLKKDLDILFLERLTSMLKETNLPLLSQKDNLATINDEIPAWINDEKPNLIYIRSNLFTTFDKEDRGDINKYKNNKLKIINSLLAKEIIKFPSEPFDLPSKRISDTEVVVSICSKTVRMLILDKERAKNLIM